MLLLCLAQRLSLTSKGTHSNSLKDRQLETGVPQLVVENITNERILYNRPHSGDCFAHVNLLKKSWDSSKKFHVTVFVPKSVDGYHFTYSATDWVTYSASSTRTGRWSFRVLNPHHHGPKTLACSRTYADRFCTYLSTLALGGVGGASGSTKSIRKTISKHKARRRMAERQKLTYTELVDVVKRTFTLPAVFLTQHMTHWTYPQDDAGPQLVTGDASAFRAHRDLQLAADVQSDVTEDLQFALGDTVDHVSLNVVVNRKAWTETGSFEVVAYEPQLYHNHLLYDNYASLHCRVCWGKDVTFKPHHKFDKGSTHVSKSTLITVAEVFVAFLELELH